VHFAGAILAALPTLIVYVVSGPLFRPWPDGRAVKGRHGVSGNRAFEKRFGAVEVLKDINLAIEEGGFLVLVGPSGCGEIDPSQHDRRP